MQGGRETLLGGIFGLGYAAMTDAIKFVQKALLIIQPASVSAFIVACLSTILFGALGAAGGWLFKYVRIEIKKFINKKRR